MKEIKLHNNITVNNTCLGAMMFGTTINKETSLAVLDSYVENGGYFVDTSNNYAHWAGTGDESETLLGEWLSSRRNRDKIVIATKVGFDRHGEGAGLKKEQIKFWIEESLRKLKTDYIDIYYAHVDDITTPLEETMEAFDDLVKSGKVRSLGGSNYDTWRFVQANTIAELNGFEPYSIMQQRFSYLYERNDVTLKYPFNTFVDKERMRYLSSYKIPLIAYSCLSGGGYDNPSRFQSNIIVGKRYEALKDLASQKGLNPSQLVISWLCNLYKCDNFTTVIPLFSSSSPEHISDNMTAAELELTYDELKYLNEA